MAHFRSVRADGFLLRSKRDSMPIVSVSLDGETPTTRTIQLRTPKLRPGVLCEVWADEEMQLCIVESVNADGSIAARRLPAPPSDATFGPRRKTRGPADAEPPLPVTC
jgi:hypothetical protein